MEILKLGDKLGLVLSFFFLLLLRPLLFSILIFITQAVPYLSISLAGLLAFFAALRDLLLLARLALLLQRFALSSPDIRLEHLLV